VRTSVDIVNTDIPAIQEAQKQAYGFGQYLVPIGYSSR
jgi:hypothetical protein